MGKVYITVFMADRVLHVTFLLDARKFKVNLLGGEENTFPAGGCAGYITEKMKTQGFWLEQRVAWVSARKFKRERLMCVWMHMAFCAKKIKMTKVMEAEK